MGKGETGRGGQKADTQTGSFDDACPTWHFRMLNDHRRNAAYEKAIERNVRPGAAVFEIGTGAGLLALMAARAGASHVYTCETSPTIALTAREIVRAHGFQDRITVLNMSSPRVRLGVELPQRVDLIISEIFGNDLLSQGCLDFVGDAKRRLLKPDGQILPPKAAIVACLIESEQLSKTVSLGSPISGFDLGLFNALSQRRIDANNELFYDCSKYRLLSDPFPVETFDLRDPTRDGSRKRAFRVRVTVKGRAHGVLQWSKIMLEEDISIENHPLDGVEVSGWERIFHYVPEIGEVRKGEWLDLVYENDRRRTRFDMALQVGRRGAK